MNDKLRKYAGSFLSLIIEQAKEYIKEGLVECEAIEKITEQVMADNDTIGIYLASDMDKTYTSFCAYMKQFAPKESIPTANEYEKRKAPNSSPLR